MNNSAKINQEYQEKLRLKDRIVHYYRSQAIKNGLQDLTRIKAYLPEKYQTLHLKRDLIFSHLGFEAILEMISKGKEFTVVSGLNPSSPLHLGHKVLFDILLDLQRLGGRIFIPLTNDESFVDGKVGSLSQSRKTAYQEIIPSILAFGFDSAKTHLYVLSDYPEIYNLAMSLSRQISIKELETIFGNECLTNPGQIFYRGAVQLAQILLPQLPEFGGPRPTLIPVGIDQHPYVLLARDIAKRLKLMSPSELVFKFQPSLRNPEAKMSGSKPKTAIYLSDSEETIREKINKAFTGSISALKAHQKLGGIPEVCSVFALLYYHHPDEDLVEKLYDDYRQGKIKADELKNLAGDFIVSLVSEHQKRKQQIGKKQTKKFILNRPLKSFL
ncbi:tryptophan--tRNA ligase [Candidatus Beckwithbacteria bacterium RBG_13_42_9]|uniref:Tryptophan--tRNA ligase n=1 Tax=Candidatus Beckwithbacteria bacterium RBG_13_42_9 TaxID=1797457 RepID=A0A1F5E3S8_9BACT|nr:MAG: tryptophan--tRNA ligase [Candidatus Beckwithbacteria bacterium RBG_13_42_9]